MKVLVYEWAAFMQEDLESALSNMNIEYETFSYEFEELNVVKDPYFAKHFGEILRAGNFDAVISMNYWTCVALACYEHCVPYISWVYDCPITLVKPELSFNLPTNHIFLFDKAEYETYRLQGYDSVFHMPLAVNVERLDQIVVSAEEVERYSADVSFVGCMYQSDYFALRNVLTDYERGYIESLIDSQGKIYGYFYINEVLKDNFLEPIQRRLQGNGIDTGDMKNFRGWMLMILSREITRRDRLMLAASTSRRCRFKLYTNEEESILKNVEYCGTVNAYDELPRVYKSSKINLNISLRQITKGIPLRALEIMGAGGFLLSNYQEELAENFQPGTECIIYESIPDAIHKVQYYLQHEEERREIAHNGHEAVRRFSFEQQLQKIFCAVFDQ